MHMLGKVGYQQSYTYFTWRNGKQELSEYLNELAHSSSPYFRPNLWVSTPDILTPYLQFGGPNGHKIRAALAALAGSSWGMYAGYELIESVARNGADEHIDSEKYQYKDRNWQTAEKTGTSISSYVTKLNMLRKEHPALVQLRNLEIHQTTDDSIIAFTKHLAAEHSSTGKNATYLILVNLDPHSIRESSVSLDLWKVGLSYDRSIQVTDLISGAKREIESTSHVRIDPFVEPAQVLKLEQN